MGRIPEYPPGIRTETFPFWRTEERAPRPFFGEWSAPKGLIQPKPDSDIGISSHDRPPDHGRIKSGLKRGFRVENGLRHPVIGKVLQSNIDFIAIPPDFGELRIHGQIGRGIRLRFFRYATSPEPGEAGRAPKLHRIVKFPLVPGLISKIGKQPVRGDKGTGFPSIQILGANIIPAVSQTEVQFPDRSEEHTSELQ